MSSRRARMLLKAMLEEYPEHAITGYLMDVHISSYCAHGRVYKHRGYGPGVLMLTETITSVLESDDGVRRYLIETVNGERLLVVNFHPTGGRRSLEILAAKFACAARLGSRYCEH